MQLESLRVFRDLVDRRSFTEAAGRNFVTQSAVSQQVKSLESLFGTQLIHRDRRGVTPTPAGRVFYQTACEVLDLYEHMIRRLKPEAGLISGSLRVATVYSVGLYEISAVVRTFLKSYPRVHLHMEYSRTHRVYEDCLAGSIDLGIVAHPWKRKGLKLIELPADELVLVCPADHPWTRKRKIGIEKLNGAEYVAFERDIPSRQALDSYLKDRGISVRVTAEFDNIETIKTAVEIGAGVSILPLMSVLREQQSGTLAVVELSGPRLKRPRGILLRDNVPLSATAASFVELLRAYRTERMAHIGET